MSAREAADFRHGILDSPRQDCSVQHSSMAGGMIDAALTCRVGEGDGAVTVRGTYTPETVQTDVVVTSDVPGGPLTLKLHTEAHRVGACRKPDRTD